MQRVRRGGGSASAAQRRTEHFVQSDRRSRSEVPAPSHWIRFRRHTGTVQQRWGCYDSRAGKGGRRQRHGNSAVYRSGHLRGAFDRFVFAEGSK